jgi:citrate synthase
MIKFLFWQMSLPNFNPLHNKVHKQIFMGIIKERFKAKADQMNTQIREMLKEHGHKPIGEVQLAQVYQGMRGMTGLVTETSLLDAQEGIRFRGYSIPELQEKLPESTGRIRAFT